MIEVLLLGGGLAFAAAIQPGPLQAFLFARVASSGWRRAMPAALSPLLSDGLVAMVVLLVIGRLPTTFQHLLRAAGGVLLVYLAWVSFDRSRAPLSGSGSCRRTSAPHTLLQAAAVNVLNPSPYLAWALVIGPTVVTAWRTTPARALAFLAAFYATMVATLGALVVLFGATSLLGARTQRVLIAVSALVLAAVGLYQLAAGLLQLLAGR